jgi:hypothetical protein
MNLLNAATLRVSFCTYFLEEGSVIVMIALVLLGLDLMPSKLTM